MTRRRKGLYYVRKGLITRRKGLYYVRKGLITRRKGLCNEMD